LLFSKGEVVFLLFTVKLSVTRISVDDDLDLDLDLLRIGDLVTLGSADEESRLKLLVSLNDTPPADGEILCRMVSGLLFFRLLELLDPEPMGSAPIRLQVFANIAKGLAFESISADEDNGLRMSSGLIY